jgi:hypothetical protein
MLRAVTRLSIIAFLLAVSAVGYVQYRKYTAEARRIAELEKERAELRRQAEQLQQVVQRLTAEKRVAEIVVTERRADPSDGTPVLSLLFVEYARDGSTLPPRQFVVRGEQVHIDGLVVEFDGELVKAGDPLRGHSIILFEKIYGSAQRPGEGTPIDAPGRIPDLYALSDPSLKKFETDLWDNFWKLAADENLRREKGVKLANGKSVYGPFVPDRLYTITLDASGKMSCEATPIKGAVGEALRRLTSANP